MKKRIIRFAGVIALLLFASMVLPFLISSMSNRLTARIINQGQREPQLNETEQTMTEKELTKRAPLDDTSQKQISDDTRQEQKEAFDAGLASYKETFHPTIKEAQPGYQTRFIGNRDVLFLSAVADYLYAKYQDTFMVNTISLLSSVNETDSELTYQIEVEASYQNHTYQELYLMTYHVAWDFYSIYGYSEQ